MKKLTAMLLALAMALSLAACGGGSNPGGNNNNPGNTQSGGDGKQDDIVLWTLSNDLKQFAERYETKTGNHVEVVVISPAMTTPARTSGARPSPP